MKGLLIYLAFTGMTMSISPAEAQITSSMNLEETLRANQWQKRVLLLCASSAREAEFIQQKQQLAQEEAGLKERDIQVLELLFDQMTPSDVNFMRRSLSVPMIGFTIVLLGKDGGIKLKQSMPIGTEYLFSTIDVMPMRRQEMKNLEIKKN